MHGIFFFKRFFLSRMSGLTKELIQSMYDQEAKAFQDSYNKRNPRAKLWIHAHPIKRAYWLVDDEWVCVYTQLTRFIFADGPRKGETFTFMGTMFVSGSTSSKQMILTALEKGEKATIVRRVSSSTLQKWRNALKLAWTTFGPAMRWVWREHLRRELAGYCSSDFVFSVCLEILLAEEGRFPLWTLH